MAQKVQWVLHLTTILSQGVLLTYLRHKSDIQVICWSLRAATAALVTTYVVAMHSWTW